MNDEGSLGIATRLAIGVILALVVNVICIETLEIDGIYQFSALTVLVTAWVVAGAARDDGGAGKAGIWALLGVGVASAAVTLFCMLVTTLVYLILFHPPGP